MAQSTSDDRRDADRSLQRVGYSLHRLGRRSEIAIADLARLVAFSPEHLHRVFVHGPKRERPAWLQCFKDSYGNLWDVLEPSEANRTA